MNHFSESRVNTNHNVTCAPSLAENDCRLLKNSEGNRDGESIFCRRNEADDALFLQVTSMRKIIKICEANLCTYQWFFPGWGGGRGGGGGQPTGIRLSVAHVRREFDILNVPRVGNLTQPPSWNVEDQGMSDKKYAILENTW